MDTRLLETAQTGEVDTLHRLMKQDPLVLDSVALTGADNPLHIASMAGHLEFVKEILALRNGFAKELSQDGFSPLHLAAANGHVEIVNELLKVGCDLCTIEGREKRIPLHYAAIKGRVHVMKILLSACPESVENQTVRGETALHLAVKNNQFEGFTLLVAHLKQFQKESVLNKQDNQGNTILHLASSRKQYEVFNQVLGEDSVTKGVVEVNSLNKVSMTALDVLLLFHSEAGDLEIESILQQAGAKRANDMHSSVTSQSQENHQHGQVPESNITMEQSEVPTTRYRSRIDQLADYFRYKKGRDGASDVRTALLTIAVLIATATYQSGFSPPGGVWQDDKNDTPKHVAGQSVMATKNSGSFFVFMFGNTIGFYTSLYMIYFLTNGFPLQLELQCSMVAITITYVSSMGTIAPSRQTVRTFTVLSIVLPLIIPLASRLFRQLKKRTADAPHNTSQEGV